jgi:hypothetical protein
VLGGGQYREGEKGKGSMQRGGQPEGKYRGKGVSHTEGSGKVCQGKEEKEGREGEGC